MNLYTVLGLTPQATAGQIRTAFRLLAQRNHPDKGGDHEVMQAIQEAYDVLSDPERRAQYDEQGATGRGPTARDKALAHLGTVLDQVIDHLADSLEYVDPIQKARDVLHQNLAEGSQVQKKLARAIQCREKVLRRAQFKGTTTNTLEAMIQGMVATLKSHLEKNEQQIATLHAALDILADYDYEVGQAPKQVPEVTLSDLAKFFAAS